MKKLTLLFALFLAVSIFECKTKAQCTSYFQSLYNPTTGDIEFTTLCTYDTSIHPILYQWDFGDGNGGYGDNPSHHYTSANAYLVCLILWVGNGPGCCQDTFCELIDFAPASIGKRPGWISDIAVSSSGKNVSVFLMMNQSLQLQMSIVMMTGRVIPVHVSNSIMQGKNEIDFGLPDYPPGIYLLRIEDMYGNSVAKRFMIY
jgi:hypothetical protein